MNVLVLMSGASQSFNDAGYVFPKSLTDIARKPLVQWMLEQLSPLRKPGARLLVDDGAKVTVIHDGNARKLAGTERKVRINPQPACRSKQSSPVTDRVCAEVISRPLHAGLRTADVGHVIERVIAWDRRHGA